MTLFKSLLIALSTYSAIPVPQFEWNEKNMKYAICFLPLVGVFCGALLWAWSAVCEACEISGLLFAAVAVCITILITGGIHMDGYMDTVDALASHGPRERKLEILKDSHCGAFAVMYCVIYFVMSFALVYELFELKCIAIFCPVFVLSRALSVLCAVNIPNARGSGMLIAYTENTKKKAVNAAMACICVLAAGFMVFLSPIVGAVAVAAGAVSVLLYCRTAKKHFGGVTGDTAGFFLQICEAFCMMGAVIGAMLL